MKVERLNEHTQRTNVQAPKEGEFLTKDVLDKMSLEDLEKIRKEMEKRCDQRGSSRPVTHANNWLDNKKNEHDYLCLVRCAIAGKLEESNEVQTDEDTVKTFEEFSPTNENTVIRHPNEQQRVELLLSTEQFSSLYDWVYEMKLDYEDDEAFLDLYDQIEKVKNNQF